MRYEFCVMKNGNNISTDFDISVAIVHALEELEDFIGECEDTRDSIEPYENKDDLTEQQQERYDWFDELVCDLEDIKSNIEELEYNINDLDLDRE